MEKFSNARVGDKVYDITLGKFGEVSGIREANLLPLEVNYSGIIRYYALNGKRNPIDKYPTLFWNEVRLPNTEEDKKTFDLVEFLRKNLKPKKFVLGETNYYLEYSQGIGWSRGFEDEWSIMGCVYFDDDITNVVKELTEQEITSEEVIQAFKTLGWINF